MKAMQMSFFSDSIKNINTIQYLGSKKELLNWIIPLIKNITPDGDTIVDLFAGTGSVGYALSDSHKIISNDIQKYSSVINQTLLKRLPSNVKGYENEFNKLYDENFNFLYKKIKEQLMRESALMQDESEYKAYALFCENTPYRYGKVANNELFKGLEELIDNVEKYKNQHNLLFTVYFSNSYFSTLQCIEIDSIRYAIKKINVSLNLKNLYLTALMSVMSNYVSATSHFAQPLKVKTIKNYKDLTAKRKVSIYKAFKEKLNILEESILEAKFHEENEVFTLDYEQALDELINKPITTIYADPPYFKEHYSRYYHVLETLIDYDYQELTYNSIIKDVTVGRYPKNRKTSDFGKKSMALAAFDKLVSKSYKLNSNLCISYSDNSIVKLDELVKVCEYHYKDIEVYYKDYTHSNQGRLEKTEVKEVLLVCKHPSKKFKGIQQTSNNSEINKLVQVITNLEPEVSNPISVMHNYLAKKPYNVIEAIIKALSNENDVVYDGFMGSGTTGYEAIKANRKFIGVDINIMAHNYFKSVTEDYNIEKFKETYKVLISDVLDKIKELYIIPCPKCNLDATIDRIFFDNFNDTLKIKKVKYICRNCDPKIKSGKFIIGREIDQKLYDQWKVFEIKGLDTFFSQPLLENKHIAIQENATIGDYFCARNKIALFELLNSLNKLSESKSKELVKFVLSSALHFFKLSDHKASSQVPYWKPKLNIVSRNPFIFLEEKFEDILNGLVYAEKMGIKSRLTSDFNDFKESSNKAFLIHDSIIGQKRRIIEDESVSLIITDPPYSDQVPYLEYTGLWDKVLKLNNLSEQQLEKEIVVSKAPSRNKDMANFNLDMEKSILEMGRILKNQKYCCFFYHDFSLVYWRSIINAANKAGLEYVIQCHIGSKQKSLKSVWTANKTLSGSALVIFRKNDNLKFEEKEVSLLDAEKYVKEVSEEIISKLDGMATSQQLYDYGVLDMVINKQILNLLADKYKSFISLFKKWFIYDEEKGVWKNK